jgi:hypothetical protein
MHAYDSAQLQSTIAAGTFVTLAPGESIELVAARNTFKRWAYERVRRDYFRRCGMDRDSWIAGLIRSEAERIANMRSQ